MTAVNIIQTHEAIHFFSDGAMLDQDGTICGNIYQKVFAFPLIRAAVGVSGPGLLYGAMPAIGHRSRSLDELLSDVGFVLPHLIADMNRDGLGGHAFSIYIGGFSESGERQLWIFDCTSIEGGRFTRVRCDHDCWHYSPEFSATSIRRSIGEVDAQAFERGFVERLDVADPVAHGLLAMEAQRRMPIEHAQVNDGKQINIVGGLAHLTSVKFDAIETRVLKRWPEDVCGAPIRPSSDIFGLKAATDAKRGIDSGASSNYDTTHSAADGYVLPSTTNSPISMSGLTKIGTLTGGGGLAAAFDGTTNQAGSSSTTSVGASTAGYNNTVGVDLGSGVTKKVTRFDLYGANNEPLVGGANTIKLQGSNDNSAWTDLHTTGSIGGSNGWSSLNITPSDTSTAYRYFRININGNGANGIYLAELILYEGSPADMTLVTIAQTADATVSNARVLIEYDNTATPTLNTDLIVEVTCDGGANWSAATLSSAGTGQAGRKVAETADTACTSGTSVQARITTDNGKSVPIHGLTLTWH